MDLAGQGRRAPQDVSSGNVELLMGRWILSQDRLAQEELVKRAHAYWRSQGFPFVSLDRQEAVLEARRFKRLLWDRSADELICSTSTTGLRLANFYHPQMWSIRGYGRKRSPIDYFEDDQFLETMLRRAPRFWPDRACWNASCVRGLFRIAAPGRVANFRPMVAAGVIRKFCPLGGKIVDFCSGYGGRLLAAIACDAEYSGIDVSAEQIAGSRRMTSDLRAVASGTVRLTRGSAVEILARMDRRSADLVFTSPPYFDKERYGKQALQSYIQFPSYGDWLQGFMKAAILQSLRILKTGGFLVLNVSDNRRFPLAADTRALMREVFGNVRGYEMQMRRLPSYQHSGTTHRAEEILVARKQSSARSKSANRRGSSR